MSYKAEKNVLGGKEKLMYLRRPKIRVYNRFHV